MHAKRFLTALVLAILLPHALAVTAPTPSTVPAPMQARLIRAHALAFTAILNTMNDHPLWCVGDPRLPVEKVQSMAKTALSRWWGVNSKAELHAMLEYLRTSGHRAAYAKLHAVFSAFPLEDNLQFASDGFYGDGSRTRLRPLEAVAFQFPTARDHDEETSRIVVICHLKDVPVVTDGPATTPIAAWDYARYIWLCQEGCEAGYLTEEEMWDLMLPMARLIQARYWSWEQFAFEYLRGREFWSVEAMRQDRGVVRRTVRDMLAPSGPWSSFAWNAPLGDGPLATDPFVPPPPLRTEPRPPVQDSR